MRSRPTVAVDLRAVVREPTGIGIYTTELLRALGGRDNFALLGLAHRPPSNLAELADYGVRVEHQPAPLGVLWQQLRLPRRLARGDIDLFWSPLFTLPLRTPVPAVVTVHDMTAFLFPEAHHWKVRWSLKPFLRPSLRRARRIVTPSRSAADDLAAFDPASSERLRVVPEGVDAAFRPASPAQVAAIRRELGAPEGYLFAAGTLEPRKNLGALLDAWQRLRHENPDCPPLVIAGGYGWGSRDLVARLERLRDEGVFLLGRVSRQRLIELFQAATVFVYPSLYEGFGLPPLEAMACAVPVVVANRSSLPEVVGDAGRRFDPDDGDGLYRALGELLAAPEAATALGRAGLERSRGFTWEKAAQAMEEIFREALE
ncbi:MAG: glycosyltransferase family 1 protein [Acidobacteriota bacterium]